MIRPVSMALAALLGASVATAARADDAARAAAGEPIFQHRCGACHALKPGKAGFGPNLRGIHGRTAGTVPGFAYSEAMQKSRIVWTDDALRQWIADNDKFVPGTRMRHVAITDPAEQDYLIAYLKTLK